MSPRPARIFGAPAATGELGGIGIAALAAIAFGTLAIFAKSAYDVGARPLPLLATRFALAALLLMAFRRLGRRAADDAPAGRMSLAALGVAYALESALFFAALERAPATVVTLVFYSFPLWTTLLGIATKLERFRSDLVVALVLGLAGIALIFSVPQTSLAGPLLALLAAFAVTGYLLMAQIVTRGVEPLRAATFTSAAAAASLAMASVATGQGLPLAALPAAGGLGVASALAFAGLYAAIRRIGATRAGIAMMLEPVTTVILAALLLDEELTLRIALGALLVVTALPILAARGAPAEEHVV